MNGETVENKKTACALCGELTGLGSISNISFGLCGACSLFMRGSMNRAFKDPTLKGIRISISLSRDGVIRGKRLLEHESIRPDPNKFIENPPKQLPPSGWVKVFNPAGEINRANVADLAFLQHLRSAKGVVNKMEPVTNDFEMYIEPGSEGAYLFIKYLLKKRPLPMGDIEAKAKELGVKIIKQLPEASL